jgi:hypothetical protein
MHNLISTEFARRHAADLKREADRERLVALARSTARPDTHRASSVSERLHGVVHRFRLVFGGRTAHPKGR